MDTTTDRQKPRKPRPDFPLTPHPSGKWCKKIKGRLYYFGRWEDPDAAERDYDRVKHDLRAGRSPVAAIDPNTLTVKELFNTFLERREERVENGTYRPRSYTDLLGSLKLFASLVGPGRLVSDLHPGDFAGARSKMADRFGTYALTRNITNVKTAFRWGLNNGLLSRPPVYGDEFNKPKAAARRKESRQNTQTRGKKLFTPQEVRALLAKAEAPLKAMILLGVNCGFYGADCAGLHRSALDLANGWMEFAREKTEVSRAAVLWPETVKALKEALAIRPKARLQADDGLVFLTKYGNPWIHAKVHRDEEGIKKASRTDAINQMFTKLLKATKIGRGVKAKSVRRKHVNFSALRHTYRTVADEVGDRNAVLYTMGHTFAGMDEFYVRDLARPRLEKIANHVRARLLEPK